MVSATAPLELSLLPFRRIRGGCGDEGSDDQEGRSGAMTRDSDRRANSVSTRLSVSSDSSTSSGGGGTGVSMTSTVADLVNSECTGGPKEDQDEEASYGSGTTKFCRGYC